MAFVPEVNAKLGIQKYWSMLIYYYLLSGVIIYLITRNKCYYFFDGLVEEATKIYTSILLLI